MEAVPATLSGERLQGAELQGYAQAGERAAVEVELFACCVLHAIDPIGNPVEHRGPAGRYEERCCHAPGPAVAQLDDGIVPMAVLELQSVSRLRQLSCQHRAVIRRLRTRRRDG